MFAYIPGRVDQPPQVMLLPVTGAYLVDGFQSFGECRLKGANCGIFTSLQGFDLFPQRAGEENDQRIEQQDEQCQSPVHPEQHGSGADQGQAGNQAARHGVAEETVQRIKIGHHVCDHCAASEAFVLSHRNTLQAADEMGANTKYDVLGYQTELTDLQDVEDRGQQAQE